jgi:LysM repeat protein
MKASWMSATLAVIVSGPALAKSELELLRERCAEQERRIHQLEEENGRLQGKPVAAPKAPEPAAAKPEAAPAKASAPTYTVVKGDTLERISRKTRVSVSTLSKLNGLKPSTIIHIGQTLKLPETPKAEAKAESTAKPVAQETISKPQETASSSKTIANPAPASATAKNEPKSEAKAEVKPASPGTRPIIRSIIIQDQITYGNFASKHGTTPDRLNELNGLSLTQNTLLAKGSELYVPAQP